MSKDLNKKQERKLVAQWKSVKDLFDAMQRDAQAGSLIDIEVGAYGLLSTMNEIRQEHNVRPHPFSEESLAKLKLSAQAIGEAASSVGTSTAIQTAAVALLSALIEAEMKQDEERMPLFIEEVKARYRAQGRVVVETEDGFSVR